MGSGYCAFTTADDGYAGYAAVALLSVREQCRDLPLFLLSSGLRTRTRRMLRRLGITPLEADLSDSFAPVGGYPAECFYIFAGPELLASEGFSHSLYLDGDVLCRRDPLVTPLARSVATFTGVSGSADIWRIFGPDRAAVEARWPQTVGVARRRINSGVVYFNNRAMQEAGLLGTAAQLTRDCREHGITLTGDDAILALVQLLDQPDEPPLLDSRYNFIPSTHKRLRSQGPDALLDQVVCFHFTGRGVAKPWRGDAYDFAPGYQGLAPFTDEWRAAARTHLGPRLSRRLVAVPGAPAQGDA